MVGPVCAASHLPLGSWAGRRRRDPLCQDGSGQERKSNVDRGRGRREEGTETRDSPGVDDNNDRSTTTAQASLQVPRFKS